MTHSDNWYVEIPEHSDEWYENRYDHKYLGQEGMRELIRIIKLHIAELDKELHDGLDGHEERISEIEQRLANVVGSSEPVKLEDFVADTLARLDVAEARLDGIDDRFDNFAESSESSETFSIEQVIDAIISQVNEIEEHLEDVDTVEIGSEVLTVQEVVDRFLEKFDELDSEDESLSDRIEELSDRAIQSIEYNGESYKPEDIYYKPQPEDQDIGYEKSSEGFVVVSEGVHHVIQAISNHCKYTKELNKGIIEYDFGARCLNEHDFLNRDGYGFKLTLGNEVISMATGLKNATVIGEIDQDGFFISDTLRANCVLEVERTEEAKELELVWQLETPPLEDPTEVLQIVYTIKVPALGDDVYIENVVVIPDDIDLSDATVRVGEGSEEERKTIKDAVDDLIADLEAEGSERNAEDEAIRDKLLELSEALDNESSERESEDVRIYNELINIINELSSESSSDIEEIIHRLDHWYESSEYEGETLEDAIDTINYNIYNLQNTTNDHETRITTLEDIVDSMEHLDYQVMTQEEFDALTEGEKGVIYLVGPVESSEDSAVAGSYVEYIYVNGEFEQIGTTEAQLSQYVRNERLDDFDHSGVSLEEGIKELVDRLNEYVTDLTTAINNEVTDRQNADTAEATARQTKDQDLQDQIDALREDLGSELDELSESAVTSVTFEGESFAPVNNIVNIEFEESSEYLGEGDFILTKTGSAAPIWKKLEVYELKDKD